MSMPRFTGEASLYKTSLHYKPAKHAINLSSQISGVVHAAANAIQIGRIGNIGDEGLEGDGRVDPIPLVCRDIFYITPSQANPFTNCYTITHEVQCKIGSSDEWITTRKSSGTQCHSTVSLDSPPDTILS
jgi:hypothetical protein